MAESIVQSAVGATLFPLLEYRRRLASVTDVPRFNCRRRLVSGGCNIVVAVCRKQTACTVNSGSQLRVTLCACVARDAGDICKSVCHRLSGGASVWMDGDFQGGLVRRDRDRRMYPVGSLVP